MDLLNKKIYEFFCTRVYEDARELRAFIYSCLRASYDSIVIFIFTHASMRTHTNSQKKFRIMNTDFRIMKFKHFVNQDSIFDIRNSK